MGHQSYVLLCTETTLSNHPVVLPKSSCDVHLLRSPWSNRPNQQIKPHPTRRDYPLITYLKFRMNWSKKEILANLKTSLSVNTRPWWRLRIQIRKIWIFLISHLKLGKVAKPFEIVPESFLRYVFHTREAWYSYSRVRNRRRAGNKRRTWKTCQKE